jgi:hypothetical protein
LFYLSDDGRLQKTCIFRLLQYGFCHIFRYGY